MPMKYLCWLQQMKNDPLEVCTNNYICIVNILISNHVYSNQYIQEIEKSETVFLITSSKNKQNPYLNTCLGIILGLHEPII